MVFGTLSITTKTNTRATSNIYLKEKQYGFLSNFAPYPVFYDGFYYPTVENAFQAAKTLNMKERKEKFDMSITPGQAKRNGRRVKLREDWEDVKVNIMYELVLQKFTVHPELTTKLLQTYPAHLIQCVVKPLALAMGI